MFTPENKTVRGTRLTCSTALQAMAPAGQAAAKGPSFADIANELEQQMGVQQSILSKLAASRKVDHAAQVETQEICNSMCHCVSVHCKPA